MAMAHALAGLGGHGDKGGVHGAKIVDHGLGDFVEEWASEA